MLIVLDNHSGVPIFRQIMDQMKEQILAGKLEAGASISSVKELGSQLGVNPMTISKAYSLLESEGFLERRRGIGMFVARPRKPLAERHKRALIDESLTRAVIQAIHMGWSEADVSAEVARKFRELSPSKEPAHGK